MRYPASEKLEIIRLVEQSALPGLCHIDKDMDRYHGGLASLIRPAQSIG